MIWLRLYRIALRALPLPLRRKHGKAMESLFVRHVERAYGAGPLKGAASGIAGLADILKRGVYERCRRSVTRRAGPTGSWSMEQLGHDVRAGARSLRRSPVFSATSIVILALGIGVSSTTFSAFRAVVLADLPLTDPDRTVLLSLQGQSTAAVPLTPQAIDEIERESRTIDQAAGVAIFGAEALPLTEGERSLALNMSRVTADFFLVLGTPPTLGRLLRPEDGEEGAAPATVLSYDAWHREFAGDPGVLGRTLTQTQYNQAYTIVGVAPPGLDFPVGVDYWIPAGPRDPMQVVARTAPDAPADIVRSEFLSIARAMGRGRSNPRIPAVATLQPLSEAVVGEARPILVAVTAAVALLLLITCLNVGNLVLMRMTGRSGEAALRRALGASPFGVARLYLAETALVGLAGCTIGVVVSALLLKALPAVAPPGFPRPEMIALSGPIAIGAGVSAVAFLLFGVAPAAIAALRGIAPALRRGAGSATATEGRRRLRRLLVSSQIALAVILLFGAGLVARSLQHLRGLELGYAPENVEIVEIGLNREAREGPEETLALLDGVQESLLSVPGVISASPIMSRPFMGLSGIFSARPMAEGQTDAEAESNPRFPMEVGGSELFRTLGIPILRGRGLRDTDREGAEKVAVVSQAVADRLWPGEDPIGRRMMIATSREYWWTVVGVAGDTRFRALQEPTPTIYVHYRQLQVLPAVWTWAIRTDGAVSPRTRDISRVAGDFDPRVHVWRIRSLREHLAKGPLSRPSLSAFLLSAFGLAALLLAALGLYAVMALSVRERTRELGVRMALGASEGTVRRAILWDALLMAATGTVAGVGAAILLAGSLDHLLFGVAPTDPVTTFGVGAVLVTVALLAAYLPARRATQTDPVQALGSD